MNDDKLPEGSWGESDVESEHRMSSWCRTVIPSNQHCIPSPDRLLKEIERCLQHQDVVGLILGGCVFCKCGSKDG